MPIPVPIPGAALPVTAADNARAESFVAVITQLLKFGTSGHIESGRPAAEPLTVPNGLNPTSTVALSLASDKEQLFYRTLGFAVLKAFVPSLAFAQSNGTTSAPTTTSTSFVVIPEMTATITTSGGIVMVVFSSTFNIVAADSFDYAIFLDTVERTGTRRTASSATAITGYNGSTQALLISVPAGSHTIDVRWKMNAGTARAVGTLRNLTVMERI